MPKARVALVRPFFWAPVNVPGPQLWKYGAISAAWLVPAPASAVAAAMRDSRKMEEVRNLRGVMALCSEEGLT